jgi:protein phosphatase
MNFNKNKIIAYRLSDKGKVRPHNEDSSGFFIPTDTNIISKLGSLFVVSDGVGGNNAGEVASAEAVNVLLQEYYFGDHSEKVPDRLKHVFQQMAMHVFDLASSHLNLRNMQCTLSALLLRQGKFFITHVGDSKIYLFRDGKMIQLTKDHTLVGKLVRLGMVSPEAARTHPNKHLLLRAVGDQPIIPPDFYSGNIMPGDLFCLISDGVLEHLTEEELRDSLEKGYDDAALHRIIQEANERGGYDNMTIMTVKVHVVA